MLRMVTAKKMDLDTAVTLIMGEVQDFRQEVHERFDGVDKRFDSIEKRLGSLEEEMHVVRSELYRISTRLDWLEEQIGNIPGFAKEIDELRERIKIIEQTLARA